MGKNAKFLKILVVVLVLVGFTFPIKAPVSSAKAKMCCKGKSHCLMGQESKVKITPMGQSESAEMISCCQDNYPSCSDTSILHSRTQQSRKLLGCLSSYTSHLPAQFRFSNLIPSCFKLS